MRTKKTLIKFIIFGVLAAALLAIGGALGLWKTDEIAGKLNFSWTTVARICIIIFATLFIENLMVFLLSLPKPENHRARTALALTSNVIKYAAAIVILCGVLAILSVDIGTILAGLGIVALIIGFGAESLIADIVTGLFILVDNQYNVGDIIEVGGFRGTVSDVGIRTTCLTDTGGNVKIINNSDMKNILNRSENASKAVADFYVPYETDLAALEEKIPALLQDIYQQHTDVMKAVPVYLGLQELGASSLTLRFVVEVGEKNIYSGARILNHDLFLGFRKLGVECPFQQIDIHQK